MGVRKRKVRCAVCGKNGIVEIGENGEILSDWGYFGKVPLPNEKQVEYWECPECLERRNRSRG